MVRILITDSVFPYNGGDAAILLTMLHDLKEVIPSAEFTVLSYYPDAAVKQLEGIAEVYHPLGKLMRGFPRNLLKMFLWSIWSVMSKNNSNRFPFITSMEKKTLQAYKNTDIVISCGGGFITDAYALYKTLYGFLLSEILRKPVMLYAQSIGPIRHRWYKILARCILNQVDLITTRDKKSKKILSKLKVTKPIICVTADSAITLAPASLERVRGILSVEGVPQKREELVGISVRRWIYPELKNPQVQFEKYKRVVAKLADYIISNLDANIVFVSTCVGEKSYAFNDADTALEILGMMRFKDKAKVITTKYIPEEVKGIIGNMSVFIGTRMHSLIFATTMGVPSIGIEYEFKTRELMKELGQEKYVCNIMEIDFENLRTMIDDLWANREKVENALKNKIKNLEVRALLNAKLSVKLLRGVNKVDTV